jgi:hypothetical protein
MARIAVGGFQHETNTCAHASACLRSVVPSRAYNLPVRPHQPRIPGDIGGENRRELSFNRSIGHDWRLPEEV